MRPLKNAADMVKWEHKDSKKGRGNVELAGNTFFFDWEVALMERLQGAITGAAASVVSFLSAFGEELLLIAILGLLYWGLDKKLGQYVGQNLLVSNALCPMIKNIFMRRRPYFDNEGIKILRPVDSDADIYDVASQGWSFPSGHSASAAAVYGSIARGAKSGLLTALAFILPFLVGFSRVFVGAHYPTDVLAGWVIGAIVVFLVPALDRAIKSRALFFLVLLVLTAPGFFFCRSNDYFSAMGMLIGFMAGTTFEEKLVRFENTKNPLRVILRVLVGGALFFGLNTLLKLPFSSEFLSGGTYGALLVRCVRYAVVLFLLIGVYPMLFKLTARIGKKKSA